MLDTPRTTNWNRMNHFPKTKAPAHLEPCARKAEIVKRVLRKYTKEQRLLSVRLKGHLETGYKIWILTHRFTLEQLKIGLATNNRKLIKKAIDDRINIRGSNNDANRKRPT